jgi:hypothetical protein
MNPVAFKRKQAGKLGHWASLHLKHPRVLHIILVIDPQTLMSIIASDITKDSAGMHMPCTQIIRGPDMSWLLQHTTYGNVHCQHLSNVTGCEQ